MQAEEEKMTAQIEELRKAAEEASSDLPEGKEPGRGRSGGLEILFTALNR